LKHCDDTIGVVMALPPKDIVRLFSGGGDGRGHNGGRDGGGREGSQLSQAELHARTNRRNTSAAPVNKQGTPFDLPSATKQQLKKVEYMGRFSLILWMEDTSQAKAYVREAVANFKMLHGERSSGEREREKVLDCVIEQSDSRVLVLQSTVAYWRQSQRNGAKNDLIRALENTMAQCQQGSGKPPSLPRIENQKLVNWRTAQVSTSLLQAASRDVPKGQESAPSSIAATTLAVSALTAACDAPPLVFTGDWCVESSFEGCSIAAQAAAQTLLTALGHMV
jgi:predicted NAD/FAD-dependent oxidoreductase